MKVPQRLLLLSLLLLLVPACASHFTTLTSPATRDSWPELGNLCAGVARQFDMRDRSYPGIGDRPDVDGWYALAFYEHSQRSECEHQAIYLLADANPDTALVKFKINNFSSGSETACAALIRQALLRHLAAAGFADVDVEHETTRAVGP